MIVPIVPVLPSLGTGELVVVSVGSLGEKGRFLHFVLEVGVHERSSNSSPLHLKQKLDYY